MHNTEGGKKINAAVTQTGKYVVQTGKAVGKYRSNPNGRNEHCCHGYKQKMVVEMCSL